MHCAGLGNVIKLLSKCTSLEFVCVSLRRAYHIFLYLYLIQIVGVMKSQKANQRNREYILVLLKRFTYTQRPQSIRCVCWMCAFFCSFSLPQLSTAILYGSNTHTHTLSFKARIEIFRCFCTFIRSSYNTYHISVCSFTHSAMSAKISMSVFANEAARQCVCALNASVWVPMFRRIWHLLMIGAVSLQPNDEHFNAAFTQLVLSAITIKWFSLKK